MLLPLYTLAGGTGTQAAIKTGCCYLSALLASGGKWVLKGTHWKGRSQSAKSQGRGWVSTWHEGEPGDCFPAHSE